MAGPLSIRKAIHGDAGALSALAIETYTQAFGHSFSPADLAAHLENNLSLRRFEQILSEDTVLLAETGGRMVGYVQFGRLEGSADQELRRLYVHSDFQNQGIGSKLMEAALAQSELQNTQRIVLDVWEHNPGAQRFYARYGFVVVGTQPFEAESGTQTSLDLIMVRRSPQAEPKPL